MDNKELSAGLASIINALTPVWTLIIANYVTEDEKFTQNKIIGILCGFLGVVVLIGPEAIIGNWKLFACPISHFSSDNVLWLRKYFWKTV